MIDPEPQRGFSLVELLISITIGLLIMAGVISLYGHTVASNTAAAKMARLNQDLRAMMHLMASDIRRAGYSGGAANTLGGGNVFEGITLGAARVTTAAAQGGCILFSYDLNNDGTQQQRGSGSLRNELFGYRLSDGRVQSRKNDSSCAGGGPDWESINDSGTVVTELTFADTPTAVDADGNGTTDIILHRITITLTGRLVSDATVSRTLSETIRVRNDELPTV